MTSELNKFRFDHFQHTIMASRIAAVRFVRSSITSAPLARLPVARCLASSSRLLASGPMSGRPPAEQKPGPASDPYPLPLQTSMDTSREDSAAMEPHPQDRPRQPDEDDKTLRARLVYQTRKRGTLETGILLSTYATPEVLEGMERKELEELDRLMTVPEWTLFYWCAGSSSLVARAHRSQADRQVEAGRGQRVGREQAAGCAASLCMATKVLSVRTERLRTHTSNPQGKTRSMPDLPVS